MHTIDISRIREIESDQNSINVFDVWLLALTTHALFLLYCSVVLSRSQYTSVTSVCWKELLMFSHLSHTISFLSILPLPLLPWILIRCFDNNTTYPRFFQAFCIWIWSTLGDMADIMTAGNDPLSFMHFAMVDMIWEMWRQRRQVNTFFFYDVATAFRVSATFEGISQCGRWQLLWTYAMNFRTHNIFTRRPKYDIAHIS